MVMSGYYREVTAIVVIATTIQLSLVSGPQAIYCGRGERFEAARNTSDKDTCVPCQSGYFWDEPYHRKKNCKKCSKFNKYAQYRKVLVDECTRFHDIELRCKTGIYYMKNNLCKACSNCTREGKVEVKPCTDLSDAACCDRKEEMIKDGECVAPEDFCQPGEFLAKDKICRSCGECKPCLNTTMETPQACDCTMSGAAVFIKVVVYILAAVLIFIVGCYTEKIFGITSSIMNPLGRLLRVELLRLIRRCGFELVPSNDTSNENIDRGNENIDRGNENTDRGNVNIDLGN